MGSLGRDLEQLVRETHGRTGIPGLAVGLSVAGERFSATAGTAGNGLPMSPESRFQIGCITKMLTSLVALDLAHAGKLSLEAPIREYLPDLTPPPGEPEITVKHLGSHTSGYRGLNPGTPQFGYFYSWPKFVDFFRNTQQVFTPGSNFNYEHTESVILGEIIRRVSGTPVDQIIQKKILQPLALQVGNGAGEGGQALVTDHSPDPATGQYRPLRAVPFCSFWMASLSNWTAGIRDLLVLGECMFAQGAAWELDARAPQHAARQVIEIPAVLAAPRSEQVPIAFGFGCAEYAGHLVGHNGSGRGQTCGLRFDTDRRMAVVVALNSWQPFVRDYLLNAVSRLVSPTPRPAMRKPAVSDLESPELEGLYLGCVPDSRVQVSRHDGELNCELADSSGAVKARMTLVIEGDGPRLKTDVPHLSVGPFRCKPEGLPCMMLGLNAFKKDTSAAVLAS